MSEIRKCLNKGMMRSPNDGAHLEAPLAQSRPLLHAAQNVASSARRLVLAVSHRRPRPELLPSHGCVRCNLKESLQVSPRPLGQIPAMRREATPLRRGPHRHHCSGTASAEAPHSPSTACECMGDLYTAVHVVLQIDSLHPLMRLMADSTDSIYIRGAG